MEKENKMELVKRENAQNTFDWIKDGQIIASITLYTEGLVEFIEGKSNSQVCIENIGTPEQKVDTWNIPAHTSGEFSRK